MHIKKPATAIPHIENLEKRVLFSVINVARYGAVVNDGRDDRNAIQRALDRATAGDLVRFEAGQYDIAGHVTIHSGQMLRGGAKDSTKLVFTTPKNEFAMIVDGANKDVTIDGLTILANAGAIITTSKTQNLHILNNDMSWGFDGDYYARFAVRSMYGNDGLMIDHNYFHDAPNDRAVDLWDAADSSYSYNTFYKVNDGGHVDGETQNFRFVGNVGSQFTRMGLELQAHGAIGNNILIANNVFTDWNAPFNYSFGLSIMPQRATNVTIENNYLSTGAQPVVSGGHFGYGIEAGFKSGVIRNNTLGGSWISAITTAIANTRLQNNASFGANAWGAWSTEPGIDGYGSINDQGGNRAESNVGNIPTPPAPATASPPAMPTAPTTAPTTAPASSSSGDLASDASSSGTYLSDIQFAGSFNSWGPVEMNSSLGDSKARDGKQITLAGKTYAKGLGVGINSSVVYTLSGRYKTFFSDVGIDEEAGNKGSMTFQVWGDGKKLFDSGVLIGSSATKSLLINVSGVKQLRLITTDAGDGGSHDHGDWAGAAGFLIADFSIDVFRGGAQLRAPLV